MLYIVYIIYMWYLYSWSVRCRTALKAVPRLKPCVFRNEVFYRIRNILIEMSNAASISKCQIDRLFAKHANIVFIFVWYFRRTCAGITHWRSIKFKRSSGFKGHESVISSISYEHATHFHMKIMIIIIIVMKYFCRLYHL